MEHCKAVGEMNQPPAEKHNGKLAPSTEETLNHPMAKTLGTLFDTGSNQDTVHFSDFGHTGHTLRMWHRCGCMMSKKDPKAKDLK